MDEQKAPLSQQNREEVKGRQHEIDKSYRNELGSIAVDGSQIQASGLLESFISGPRISVVGPFEIRTA
jgi:hypothetical protein